MQNDASPLTEERRFGWLADGFPTGSQWDAEDAGRIHTEFAEPAAMLVNTAG